MVTCRANRLAPIRAKHGGKRLPLAVLKSPRSWASSLIGDVVLCRSHNPLNCFDSASVTTKGPFLNNKARPRRASGKHSAIPVVPAVTLTGEAFRSGTVPLNEESKNAGSHG